MEPTDSLLARLKELEENLRELERFRAWTPEEVQADRKLTWALRYGMLESIQIVIDVACAVVSRFNLGYPESYAACLRLLGQQGFLETELALRLAKAVGMRNIMIHDYLSVDDGVVYAALDHLTDFSAFARHVVSLLREDA